MYEHFQSHDNYSFFSDSLYATQSTSHYEAVHMEEKKGSTMSVIPQLMSTSHTYEKDRVHLNKTLSEQQTLILEFSSNCSYAMQQKWDSLQISQRGCRVFRNLTLM